MEYFAKQTIKRRLKDCPVEAKPQRCCNALLSFSKRVKTMNGIIKFCSFCSRVLCGFGGNKSKNITSLASYFTCFFIIANSFVKSAAAEPANPQAIFLCSGQDNVAINVCDLSGRKIGVFFKVENYISESAAESGGSGSFLTFNRDIVSSISSEGKTNKAANDSRSVICEKFNKKMNSFHIIFLMGLGALSFWFGYRPWLRST